VIYQIDRHCRRLLWLGRRRTQRTLRRGLAALGTEVVKGLRFVCSDMARTPPSWRWAATKAATSSSGAGQSSTV
jgi:transposase